MRNRVLISFWSWVKYEKSCLCTLRIVSFYKPLTHGKLFLKLFIKLFLKLFIKLFLKLFLKLMARRYYSHKGLSTINMADLRWSEKNVMTSPTSFFLGNQFKLILSMYRPTGGYGVVTNRIDSRPANLLNSKRLSKTSYPCSGSSSILFRFSTESYGKTTVLGDRGIRRRVCGKSEMCNRTNEPLHSPSVVWVSARIHCGPIVFSTKSA